jgi:ketosteroid isomerase-like protein
MKRRASMHTLPAEIARASYEAYARKDRAAIERLIAADFRFSSPLDNQIDRATYFERCWPNSEDLDHFEFLHVVPDGNRVFVTYEARTSSGHRFRNTELVTVHDDQIAEVEVYFGWSIPHDAPPGGFIEEEEEEDQDALEEAAP